MLTLKVLVMTVGNDVKVIEKNMKEAVELYLKSCKDMNIAPVEVLQGEFTLKFKIDAATFINYYSSNLYQSSFEPDNRNQ